MAARERHLLRPYLPLPRGEYVIFKICFFFILVIYWAFLRLTLCTCFLLIKQFKYKEDTYATRPILLDEPKVEVHPFPFILFYLFFFFFAFPYLCMHSCPFFIVFFLYAYLPFFSYFDLLSLSLSRAISVYHPMSEEAPVTIGTPIEGFFDGTDVVA